MSDEDGVTIKKSGGWVKFDDESSELPKSHNSVRGTVNSIDNEPGSLPISEIEIVNETQLRKKSSPKDENNQQSLNTIHLQESRISRHQSRNKVFSNGDIIVTLLPVNERLPWITPAKFRPELVPEELMAPSLTITIEDYVQTLEKLTTDMRFTIYNLSYKRILALWITLAFIILLSFLFSFQGINLFAFGVAWLVLNAFAIFFCMWIKLKLSTQLERCMASLNSNLLKHKILLAVDDRGKLSCHKVHLCFLFFDSGKCIDKLLTVLEDPSDGVRHDTYLREQEGFRDIDVIVSGQNSIKMDKKRDKAEKLFLHYIQRWGKDFLRRRLDWMIDDDYGRGDYVSNGDPRHLNSALCPCQYIEEHLRNKRQRESLNPCKFSYNPCKWFD